jgi:hypothetical protein
MNGFMVESEGMLIKSTMGKPTLVFDQRLNIKGDFVSDIKMVPVLNEVANTFVVNDKFR